MHTEDGLTAHKSHPTMPHPPALSRAAQRRRLASPYLAFTLVELLIALAIMAVLAAILFPVFARAVSKSRGTVCQSNLLNIGVAFRIYAADYFGHLPPRLETLEAAHPYLPSQTLACPEAAKMGLPRTRYLYRPGLSDDDAPLQAVAADAYKDVHNDGFNILWLDGHVKWCRLDSQGRPRGAVAKASPGIDELVRQQQSVEEGEGR